VTHAPDLAMEIEDPLRERLPPDEHPAQFLAYDEKGYVWLAHWNHAWKEFVGVRVQHAGATLPYEFKVLRDPADPARILGWLPVPRGYVAERAA
jgi:hypothetical protein